MGDFVVTYSYEPTRNFVTQVRNKYKNDIISEYNYKYDDLGRRTSVIKFGSAFVNGNKFNIFFYNDKSELTGYSQYPGTDVNDAGNSVPEKNKSYHYDQIGNRRQFTETDIISVYVTNNLNQYVQQVTGTENMTFKYDEDGNLTSLYDGAFETEFIWNAENRMVSAVPVTPDGGDKKIGLIYDYMGRRVKKSVCVWNSGKWNKETEKLFIYNGWNLIREITVENGKTTEKSYLWGLDISRTLHGAGGIGGLLAVYDHSKSEMYYFLYDANGNVSQLINSETGEIVAHYEYDAFGNIIFSYGTYAEENPFRWSTKYYDAETGLYYYGKRYYSPSLGRWASRDPIEEEDGQNFYVMLRNNPVNHWDFIGLLVFGAYDLDSQYLVITDEDTHETIVLCAESGGNPYGKPIPGGKYEILERAGRAEFYRLDAIDSKPRNDTHEPTGRTELRLHKPGRTIGCIAAAKDCKNCWESVVKLINKTKTLNVDVTSHRRFEFIRGPAKENIKKYGELRVIRSGVKDEETKRKCECNCSSDN